MHGRDILFHYLTLGTICNDSKIQLHFNKSSKASSLYFIKYIQVFLEKPSIKDIKYLALPRDVI
jgi:hypothetical protein